MQAYAVTHMAENGGDPMNVTSKLEKFRDARQAMDSPAHKRIRLLTDPDSFVEIGGFAAADGGPSGVVCGFGAVFGSPVYVFAQDGGGGGAVGAVHAAKIAKLYDLALKTGVPVVGIYDSNGARVSEGAGALSAYGDILQRVNNLSGVVPQLALVLGTCAGTSALLACSADFVIMSEQAEFFMAPPSLSADAPGAGSARNAAAAGVAHIVCADDEAACSQARRLLAALPLNNLASPPYCDYTDPAAGALTALSAGIETADPAEIVANICDEGSAVELLAGFGKSVYTAIATMAGIACGCVATRPGKLDADSCAKIAKVVSVCDCYQLPVLTFVNTSGFAPSAKAELCGSVRDMARLAHVYAEATTAKIAVVTGEAYGAAYVALCCRPSAADYTVAWPGATISALEPRTAVAFQYADRITAGRTREQVEEDYANNEASPLEAAACGAIDDVIDPAVTRPALLAALDLLSAKRVSRNPKKHSNIPM